MLGTAYEWQQRLAQPARTASGLLHRILKTLPPAVAGSPGPRLLEHSGDERPATSTRGNADQPPLEPAPGSYVLDRTLP
jgi:hypothetical protein